MEMNNSKNYQEQVDEDIEDYTYNISDGGYQPDSGNLSRNDY